MRRDVMENAGLAAFAEVGLVLFVVVFLIILLRVVLMRRDAVEHMGRLPLEDDQRQAEETER